ncbi:MAG: glycosyltransferase family 2 protein [Prevotella sp.]|nr:glycosyltransferase family 2 protein [Prevotella sp.]
MTVSVLVPVYGVEKYIGECVESLFAQTYDDLEYIFVDDCTPDGSMAILEDVLSRYPHRKGQVRIIRHEHNRGLGAARKTAFDAATGEFVMHVDSDDYLPIGAVRRLVEAQQQSEADIVSGSFQYHYPDGSLEKASFADLDRQLTLRLFLTQNTIPYNIWARLIRKSLFTDHGISAIEGINYAEDYALTSRLLLAAGKTEYVDDVVYVYRMDSVTGTFHQEKRHHIESMLKANEVVYQYFRENDKTGQYSYALELGMMNTRYRALAAGLTRAETAALCSYKPRRWLFRACHALFAHKPTRSLLRYAYLAIKWCYKRRLNYRF